MIFIDRGVEHFRKLPLLSQRIIALLLIAALGIGPLMFTRSTDASADPYTVFMLHANGGDASNATRDDSNFHPKGITFNGNAQLDTAQSKFGGSSILFDGTGDYLQMEGNNDFAFGTGDFTIDFWVRPNSVSGSQNLYDSRPASTDGLYPTIYMNGTSLRYLVSGADRITGATVLATGTWYHVALVRSGGSTKLYLNGTQEGSTYTDSNAYINGASRPRHGCNRDASSCFNGWTDELRVSKGIARWTSNFTPPTLEYPNYISSTLTDFITGGNSLIVDADGADTSTTFTDETVTANTVTVNGNAQVDTAQSKFGGASVLFDGTDDYLNLDGSTDFAFGPDDFTIDFWVRRNATGADHILYDSRTSGVNGLYPTIYITSGNVLKYYTNSSDRITGTTAITTGAWYHVALVRQGYITKLYLNGVQEGANYIDPNVYLNGTSRPAIGTSGNSVTLSELNGWMDEIRVVKGTALWTSNFTPPTSASTDGWQVPADWNSSNNTIRVYGGGGGGNDNGDNGHGGGGGAYSEVSNVSLTPGAYVSYSVGGGGAAGLSGDTTGDDGGDTWFNGTTCGGASACAKAGTGASGASAGTGGAAGSGVGSTKYSGGNGGIGHTTGDTGGGGGGAAGPSGAGAIGGPGNTAATTGGGGGGGGANNGTAGSMGTNGGTGGDGAKGGEGPYGWGGGATSTVIGYSGSAGGGGGGGETNQAGGEGGSGMEWPATTPLIGAVVASSSAWSYCASEPAGQTCTFSGMTRLVRYGVNGSYAYGTFANSMACNNTPLGDPASGQSKFCHIAGGPRAGYGAGGGGGGAGDGRIGGVGGLYGGGGGGGEGGGGPGAPGLIVISYTSIFGQHRTITLNGNVKFAGNLAISGSLSKSSGTFNIDHPLAPLAKLLFHSFVESPEAKNVYDGVVTLDDRGEARVQLPRYFEALNKDFRYQFFPHFDAMPDLYVKEEVKDNAFVIAGGKPGGEISWQITGVRHDPYIVENPIVNEVLKDETTEVPRGKCLFEPLCR